MIHQIVAAALLDDGLVTGIIAGFVYRKKSAELADRPDDPSDSEVSFAAPLTLAIASIGSVIGAVVVYFCVKA